MSSKPTKLLIRRRILAWFSDHQRDLPWRRTKDPYAIAVSEVMLQQTQVDRVIPKYNAWLRAFPSLKKLAGAPLTQVLQYWSGLGYNSRGVRLRQMARDIKEFHAGEFPTTVEALESLPGVGAYTARAIASFAFEKDEAVIDTNVRRVVSRIFFGVKGPNKPTQLPRLVAGLLPNGKSHEWNAALMDFGALVCQSRRPKCEMCPVRNYCLAYPDVLKPAQRKKVSHIPFKQTDRFWRGRTVALLVHQGPHTMTELHKALSQVGEISRLRLETIIENLSRSKVLRRSGRLIQIQA